MLYLDNAATTPVRREVIEAMWPYLTNTFGNPSSHHTVGEAAAAGLDDARRRIATVLGTRPGDIVFTSGGTEADNLAVKGLTLGSITRGRHVVTSAVEHEAVVESFAYLRRLHDVEVTTLPVDRTGRVDADEFAAALRPDTVLASVMAANNEIGTVQDLAALGAIARAARVPLHTDAVQAAGWLPLGLDRLGVDALSLSGHKLGAPKGIGLLAVRGALPLEPLVHGGGQERGRRSGTENVAAAVGLATAIELAEEERAEASGRVTLLRDAFIALVLQQVPGARLTGHPEHRLPGIASFVFPGTSGEAVLLELERRGVVSSSGSACAAGSDEPSAVLLAIGVEPAVAQTAVRFSCTTAVTARELDDAASAVVAAVAAVASLA
ncbi:cysteine desulfurase family protein [Plantibacter sp. LMC-P-059a]|uniref:cysteine desulfurase family protein n=1 Tax=Plantibacter sp. LMC-P-059a TaxID=3040297 RepID=UPI00254E1FA2|nr:cysteine desulfurase family protein [Plantibacter sp. LMC-P-059a]